MLLILTCAFAVGWVAANAPTAMGRVLWFALALALSALAGLS